MFKSVGDEWSLSLWQDFTFMDIKECTEGWEPILAIQEIGRHRISSNEFFEDHGLYMCGQRSQLSVALPYSTSIKSASKNFSCPLN